MMRRQPTIADDLIEGAENIGRECGWSVRRTFHLLETGALPGFKLGGKWCVRRSTVLANFQRLEGRTPKD